MKKLFFSFVEPIEQAEEREEIQNALSKLTTCPVSVDADGKHVTVSVEDETQIFSVRENLIAGAAANGKPVNSEPTVLSDEDAGEAKKAGKKMPSVSLGTFIVVICLSILAAVLFTTAVFVRNMRSSVNVTRPGSQDSGTDIFPEITTIDSFFKSYGYDLGDVTDQELVTAMMKAYCQATGDQYAYYYDEKELEAQQLANQGTGVGMGVNIVDRYVDWNETTYAVVQIVRVYEGSPAYEAGMLAGDCIYAIGTGDSKKTINSFQTFNEASALLKAEKEGDIISFTVLRPNGDTYEEIPFNIEARLFIAPPVSSRISETDPSVGIVTVTEFNLSTPLYFKSAMNALIAQGIERFVIDLRNNPGGELKSIEAVLSYFLNENDLMIRIRGKNGSVKDELVSVRYNSGTYAECSVKAEEIGMYKDYAYAVLVNENTASAAELFTSNFRDHNIGTIVGVKTYGKGCMQNMYLLSAYGIPGALKLTTHFYDPPSLVNYDGIGISPTEGYEVEVPEAYRGTYVTLIPEADDAQLQSAIQAANLRHDLIN